MSEPTKRLRQMLDERGVKWSFSNKLDVKTYWPNSDGVNATATDWGDGLLVHAVMTPEQAIAATLGAETCHDTADTPEYKDKTRFECSVCGYEYDATGGYGCDFGDEPWFSYCPHCGRRVVE